MTSVPSGHQFEIARGDQRATIVEVGGGLRTYAVGDRPVLDPYPLDAMCDGAHGAVLVPWPNRLADGRYRFDGTDLQVPLDEPEKHNAIHGLLRWRNWTATDQAPDRVRVAAILHPMSGYPFHLETEVTYELGDAGLTVTTSATNAGTGPCPYASGQHPYLSPGAGLIDECTVQLDGRTRILTDNPRQLPAGVEAVAGTSHDFTTARPLGDQQVDDPFTDLIRDDAGRAWVRLSGADGRRVELWVDEAYPLLEMYTGDTLGPDRARRGLGVEPMTAPPNAFQSGDLLVHLQPGETHTASWGVRLV